MKDNIEIFFLVFPNGLYADDIQRSTAMWWQINWSKRNILKADDLNDKVQGSANTWQSDTVKS